MSIKIMIVDDHESARLGVRYLIEKTNVDMTIVGEANNGYLALEMVADLRPDIVIMDVSMPELNGIETTRKIMRDYPQSKVIALSIYKRTSMVVEMLKAGTSGYILKENISEDLVTAIKAALSDKIYLSPEINGIIVADYVGGNLPRTTESISPNLTPREREILQRLAEGHHVKGIAQSLGLSPKTIESIRSKIAKKLKTSNLAEMTKYAIREGLTTIN